jgi:predicted enzyme related to lactoylglutathione lyase
MQHGSIIFVEIPVRDLARSADFYAGLFGWSFLPGQEPDRWLFVPGGKGAMGAITTSRSAGSVGTHLAIAVDDVRECSEHAIALGGGVTAVEDRESLGYGAELIDPDGNHFWVFERRMSRTDVATSPPVWHDVLPPQQQTHQPG